MKLRYWGELLAYSEGIHCTHNNCFCGISLVERLLWFTLHYRVPEVSAKKCHFTAQTENFADLELSCQVGQNQKWKCRFTYPPPPPPPKWKLCRFGTFMSSWTSEMKVPVYPPPPPPPPKVKTLQIWNFHAKLDLTHQSATSFEFCDLSTRLANVLHVCH